MLALLFWRTRLQGPEPYWEKVESLLNPVPFETTTMYIKVLIDWDIKYVQTAIINLVGNLIMFVPLGMFLPGLFLKLRRWWRVLLTGAGIIVLVEAGQMLTLLGTCDMDDLILNTVGILLGYWLWHRTEKKRAA